MNGRGRSLRQEDDGPRPALDALHLLGVGREEPPGLDHLRERPRPFQGWLTSLLQTWVVMVGTKLRSSARRIRGISAGSRWTCMSAEYQPSRFMSTQRRSRTGSGRAPGHVQVELDGDVLQPALDPEPVLPGREVELEVARDEEVPLVAPRVGREARGQERLVSPPQVGPGGDRLPPGVVDDLDAHRGPGRGSEPCAAPRTRTPTREIPWRSWLPPPHRHVRAATFRVSGAYAPGSQGVNEPVVLATPLPGTSAHSRIGKQSPKEEDP